MSLVMGTKGSGRPTYSKDSILRKQIFTEEPLYVLSQQCPAKERSHAGPLSGSL